jgi:hypothetical protein
MKVEEEGNKVSPFPSLPSITSGKLLVSDSFLASNLHISEAKNADSTYITTQKNYVVLFDPAFGFQKLSCVMSLHCNSFL